MHVRGMTALLLVLVLAVLSGCPSGDSGAADPGPPLDPELDAFVPEDALGEDPGNADVAREPGASDAAVEDVPALPDETISYAPVDSGSDVAVIPIPGACVTAPVKAPGPTGPLPEPPQPAR